MWLARPGPQPCPPWRALSQRNSPYREKEARSSRISWHSSLRHTPPAPRHTGHRPAAARQQAHPGGKVLRACGARHDRDHCRGDTRPTGSRVPAAPHCADEGEGIRPGGEVLSDPKHQQICCYTFLRRREKNPLCYSCVLTGSQDAAPMFTTRWL